jgi:hypothetical protein
MRGSGKIFAVSCRPTAIASSVVSGSATVALASRRQPERSLIALQIDFVLGCCDAQVVAAEGQFLPPRFATAMEELARRPDPRHLIE